MWIYFVISGVILLDQAVKYFVQNRMYVNESISVIGEVFRITFIMNKGAAFGMLSDLDSRIRIPFFLILGFCFLGFVIFYFKKILKEGFLTRLSFSLIAGGAAGNLIDRITFHGQVRDFIELGINTQYKFAVFNIADAAISTGVCLLIINYMAAGRKEKNVSRTV
ncbi:MAG: signal peptidase II [Candidatus Firestonebacteria bacterium]